MYKKGQINQLVYIDGHKRFKIIVDGIYKSILSLIPGGEAIKELKFGIKESIENAELREIIESVYKEIKNIFITNSEINIKQISTEQIITLLLKKPFAEPIISKLDKANSALLYSLAIYQKCIMRLNNKIDLIDNKLSETIKMMTSDRGNFIDILNRNLNEKYLIENEIIQINSKLDLIINQHNSYSHTPDEKSLHEIVKNLRSIDDKIILSEANNLKHAFEIYDTHKMGTDYILSVDFSELYNYAYAPFNENILSAYSVYLFNKINEPIYILPGGISELKYHLNITFNHFINYHDLKENLTNKLKHILAHSDSPKAVKFFISKLNSSELSLLINSAFNKNEPLHRLNKLLKSGLIKTWDTKKHDLKEYQEIFEHAFQLFTISRPLMDRNNMNDAFNIAIIAQYNSNIVNDKLLYHITSSYNMIKIANNFISPSFRLKKNPKKYISCIYLNHTWSWLIHILNNNFDESNIDNILSSLHDFDEIRNSIIEAIKKDKINILTSVIRRLFHYRESLEHFKLISSPFQKSILKIEQEDFWGEDTIYSINDFINKFEDVYENIMFTIKDILSYLEPLEESYKPFSDLKEKLLLRENENNK